MWGPPVAPTACAWTLGACTAEAIAELDRIDPATPSARIAGMMIGRPMRMIPPWRFPRSAGRLRYPADLHGVSTSCGAISRLPVISCTSPAIISLFVNTEISNKNIADFLQERFTSPCGGMFAQPCAERSRETCNAIMRGMLDDPIGTRGRRSMWWTGPKTPLVSLMF